MVYLWAAAVQSSPPWTHHQDSSRAGQTRSREGSFTPWLLEGFFPCKSGSFSDLVGLSPKNEPAVTTPFPLTAEQASRSETAGKTLWKA